MHQKIPAAHLKKQAVENEIFGQGHWPHGPAGTHHFYNRGGRFTTRLVDDVMTAEDRLHEALLERMGTFAPVYRANDAHPGNVPVY